MFQRKIKTSSGHSDRMSSFKDKKTKIDFFNWIEEMRKDVEGEHRITAVINNCGMI